MFSSEQCNSVDVKNTQWKLFGFISMHIWIIEVSSNLKKRYIYCWVVEFMLWWYKIWIIFKVDFLSSRNRIYFSESIWSPYATLQNQTWKKFNHLLAFTLHPYYNFALQKLPSSSKNNCHYPDGSPSTHGSTWFLWGSKTEPGWN